MAGHLLRMAAESRPPVFPGSIKSGGLVTGRRFESAVDSPPRLSERQRSSLLAEFVADVRRAGRSGAERFIA